jgi:PDZ domain-containing secreted protein
MDDFGKMLKFKNGDQLVKLNGKVIDITNIKNIFGNYFTNTKEGDLVTFEIARPKFRKGKFKYKTLKANAKRKISKYKKYGFGFLIVICDLNCESMSFS